MAIFMWLVPCWFGVKYFIIYYAVFDDLSILGFGFNDWFLILVLSFCRAVVFFIPFGEFAETVAERGVGLEAEVALKRGGVGESYGDIARLHGDEFFVGFKVVILGEDAGADEFFLENLDEVEEVFWVGVADVVDFVGRERKAVFAGFLFGGVCHDAEDAFDDVVDVGEVTLAVAVVEDFDFVAFDKLVGEAEICHVGAAGGTVDGEEAETGGGDVVEFGVGVGEELVGFFGGSVKGDGIVDLVVGAERDFFVAAVDGAAGGVDEMFDGVVAAGFEDVVETDEVGFDVDVGVIDAVADAGLGGEVDDEVWLFGFEELVYGGLVGEVALDESEVFMLF